MKQSKTVKEQPTTEINSNQFDNALSVMHNKLARATTKWNKEESKLFLLTISQINSRDEKGYVSLNRKDLMKTLDISNKNASNLKKTAENMMHKSMVKFENGDNFNYGFLFTNTQADRKTVKIRVNDTYMSMLEQLSSQFTQIYIENIIGLNSKHAISLYMYLSSWYNSEYLIQKTTVKADYLKTLFNLQEGQYWRDVNTDHPRFNWSMFEQRVIKQAISDINENKQCDIVIKEFKKIKDGKDIKGYEFTWGPVEQYENYRVWSISDYLK